MEADVQTDCLDIIVFETCYMMRTVPNSTNNSFFLRRNRKGEFILPQALGRNTVHDAGEGAGEGAQGVVTLRLQSGSKET